MKTLALAELPYFLDQNPRILLVSAFQKSGFCSRVASIRGRLLLNRAPTSCLNGKFL